MSFSPKLPAPSSLNGCVSSNPTLISQTEKGQEKEKKKRPLQSLLTKDLEEL
jgi:hypothetical protein